VAQLPIEERLRFIHSMRQTILGSDLKISVYVVLSSSDGNDICKSVARLRWSSQPYYLKTAILASLNALRHFLSASFQCQIFYSIFCQ
jgi:hypothetical protein